MQQPDRRSRRSATPQMGKFGELLRELREARGLSLVALGSRVGMSREVIRRIEVADGYACSRELAHQLELVLKTQGLLLREWAQMQGVTDSGIENLQTNPPPRPTDGPCSDAHHRCNDQEDQLSPCQAGNEADRERISHFANLPQMHDRHATSPPHEPLVETSADHFRQQLEILMRADGERGPRETLPHVRQLMRAILEQAHRAKLDMRRELLSVGARCAEFTGWLCRDLQDTNSGGYWYDRSMEWAQEAGDLPMQGYVLLRKSQMAFDDRDGPRMLALAEASLNGPWGLPARVRVEAMQQEARGHAMVGGPNATIERKLDQARDLLDRAEADGDPQQLGATFDEATLTLRTASCYVESGRPRKASALYHSVLRARTLSPRDHGYFLARRASALALAGEPDAAAAEGLQALRLASSASSSRTARELSRTLDTLRTWKSRPGPRELHEALLDWDTKDSAATRGATE